MPSPCILLFAYLIVFKLVSGHLQVCRELVAISPLSTKVQLGNQDNGPNLLSSLLFNYLFPASKVTHDVVCLVHSTQTAPPLLFYAPIKFTHPTFEENVHQEADLPSHEIKYGSILMRK